MNHAINSQQMRENSPFYISRIDLFATFAPSNKPAHEAGDEVEQMEFVDFNREYKHTDCVYQAFDKLFSFTPECPNPFALNRMYSMAEIIGTFDNYAAVEIVAAQNGCSLGVDLGRVLPAICMEFESKYVTHEYKGEPTNFILVCGNNHLPLFNHCIAIQKSGTSWIWYDSATNVATKFRNTANFYEFLRAQTDYTVKAVLCVEPRPFPY